MSKVYILLATKKFSASESKGVSFGLLNVALAKKAQEVLSATHQVTLTNIGEGFDYKEEREKLISHDLVIMQFPIYWFNVPHYLKYYMDSVYISPEFWSNTPQSLDYGHGGKLNNKYMLSVTFNAPAPAFSVAGVTAGKNSDEILNNVHITQQYLGMKALPTFQALNVYDVYDKTFETKVDYVQEYEKHLERFVINCI